MTRQINQAGLALITQSEGLRLGAYQDAAGIWTIGYGHVPAFEGETVTPAQAEELLRADLEWAQDAVVSTADGATDNQFAAMTSLCFNIGAGAFRSSSVLRLHLAGDFAGAGLAFLLWDKVHADGGLVESPGLFRRRQAERALYLS
jgi:lysozyme